MKKRFKIWLLSIGILLVLSILVSVSYAYFYFGATQSGSNVAQSACFKLTYSDRNDINLVDTIPISDTKALDLTPYEFTITNTCNLAATYYVNIETITGSDMSENYLKYKLDNNSPAILGTIEDNETLINESAVSSRTIDSAILLGGETRTYNLRLWIDEEAPVEAAGKVFTSKVVVTATLNKNPYVQIALNANDGTIDSNSISFVNGRFMSTLPTPTKKGYIFLGWYSTPTFDEGTGVGVDTPASASVTNLYAKYTEDTFTLSIDPDGGEYNNSPGVYETNVTYKNVYVIDGTIEKEGYTFTNWSVESGDETTLVGNTVTMGNEDALVKANYNINSYKLTVDPNGGTWDSYTTSQEYNMDYHTTKNIPNPTKEGYTFTGWSITSGDLSGTTFTIGASDAVLTANWQVNDYKWIVYHNKMNVDGNGYTLADSEAGHGNYGTTFNGTLKNYTGFNNPTQASKTIGEDIKYGVEGTPTNNVLNYNYARQQFSVTVNPNGGSYASSTSSTTHSNIYYQSTYTINNPTRTGYNFSGWSLSGANSSISGTTFTMGSANATLTAGWTVKTTTVTLNKQSGSGGTSSVTATYGSAMPSATAPTRSSYIFGGYYTGTNGSGTQYYNASMQSVKNWDKEDASITLYAKWDKAYTILSGNLSTVGSEVKIADEEFYVIGQEDSTHVKLLSKWNLKVGNKWNLKVINTYSSSWDKTGEYTSSDTGYNLQSSDMKGYVSGAATKNGTIPFSSTNYWSSTVSTYPAWVYTNEKTNGTYKASIAEYVDNYVTYLTQQGVSVTGRLIKQEELVTLGCNASTYYCDSTGSYGGTAPSWVYQTSYWSGSATWVKGTSNRLWVVYSDGGFDGDYYDNDSNFGVRPVIILAT